jgi:hypothetical protein
MKHNPKTPKRARPSEEEEITLMNGEMMLHPVDVSLMWAFTQRWSQDCQGDQASAIFNPGHWTGDSVSFISYIDPQNTYDSRRISIRYNVAISHFYPHVPVDEILRCTPPYLFLTVLLNALGEGDIYLAYELTSEFSAPATLDAIENWLKSDDRGKYMRLLFS